MLNLRNDIKLTEEATEALQRIHAQIRDLLIEEEQVYKQCLESNREIYLTKEETAKLLRIEDGKLPRDLERTKVRKQWLFNKKTVLDYLDSHTHRNKPAR